MTEHMSISLLWSKAFLTSKLILWSLFIVNFAGTYYGYVWYWNQLVYTAEEKPFWYVLFVPDSPTASLFFTLSLLYLLYDRYKSSSSLDKPSLIRGIVEVFALITSIKYGVWAVAMILAGAAQGDAVSWQDWMLTASHLGMAAEVLLFARFYTFRIVPIAIVAIWTLWNDFMDYGKGIFPWLPKVLDDDLGSIETFTIFLSLVCILIACVTLILRKKDHSSA